MSELQNPVCWGVFAKIDGQFVLQPPVEPTEAMAKQAAARFVPGTELEIKPMGVLPNADWLAGFAKEVQQAVESTSVVIDHDGVGPDRAVADVVAKYAAQADAGQQKAIGAAIREALANLDTVRSSVELGRTGTALARLDDAIALLKGTREGGAR